MTGPAGSPSPALCGTAATVRRLGLEVKSLLARQHSTASRHSCRGDKQFPGVDCDQVPAITSYRNLTQPNIRF